jgi:hypothetical protein
MIKKSGSYTNEIQSNHPFQPPSTVMKSYLRDDLEKIKGSNSPSLINNTIPSQSSITNNNFISINFNESTIFNMEGIDVNMTREKKMEMLNQFNLPYKSSNVNIEEQMNKEMEKLKAREKRYAEPNKS